MITFIVISLENKIADPIEIKKPAIAGFFYLFKLQHNCDVRLLKNHPFCKISQNFLLRWNEPQR